MNNTECIRYSVCLTFKINIFYCNGNHRFGSILLTDPMVEGALLRKTQHDNLHFWRKSEAKVEVPLTCMISTDQQVAPPLFEQIRLSVWKAMRERLYCSLDLYIVYMCLWSITSFNSRLQNISPWTNRWRHDDIVHFLFTAYGVTRDGNEWLQWPI